jgi:manganese-dependent ADP-ribose/CDP-alcohol diphosphatase
MKRKYDVIFRNCLIISIISFLLICNSCSTNKSTASKKEHIGTKFSFGLIADCQYCNIVGNGQRKYSQSVQKLKSCVDHLNSMDLSYVIHLGDFIDRDWESFDVVDPIFSKLTMPGYHVLGNHDFSVEDSLKGSITKRMGLPSPYYHFGNNGWRFIILDGNDISFHAHPKGSVQYNAAEEYYIKNQITSPKWNGAIGSQQMKWLEESIKTANKQGENVILFSHFPVYPENVHNLWNAGEVVSLIEKYPNVKAYINGHNHEGNYSQKNGIHYLTMKGMVDTEQNSYGVMTITKDHLLLSGYGREEDREFTIRK